MFESISGLDVEDSPREGFFKFNQFRTNTRFTKKSGMACFAVGVQSHTVHWQSRDLTAGEGATWGFTFQRLPRA
jgi:hypothetical protein